MPVARRQWPVVEPYDFWHTTRLLRTGGRDPTVVREPDGLWRTAHTPEGPATVRIRVLGATQRVIGAWAWGPGAAAALDQVPYWVGLVEAPWRLPAHPVTDRLLKTHAGIRMTDTRNVFEAVVNAVLQQLVTWNEAAMTWRRLVEGLGEPAPRPGSPAAALPPELERLRLSPTPEALLRAGEARLQSFEIGRKRARTLLHVARAAHVFEEALGLPTDEAAAHLEKVRGIGPWTSATVLGMRMGRPEPVLLGDYHLPNTVAWALAGEPRGTEERMLELLEPFDGHAFRVVRLIYAAGISAPRRGPKRAMRQTGL
jgi:3-methyladenine DNA glycosylase/8-oxoguanine DNA glycosylase